MNLKETREATSFFTEVAKFLSGELPLSQHIRANLYDTEIEVEVQAEIDHDQSAELYARLRFMNSIAGVESAEKTGCIRTHGVESGEEVRFYWIKVKYNKLKDVLRIIRDYSSCNNAIE